MIGEEHKAGMVDVGSKVGMSEEDMLMVPEIGTPGTASWQERASGGVMAAVGAGRWEGRVERSTSECTCPCLRVHGCICLAHRSNRSLTV
jgi:hypothetical protein